jgi:hypothetical protein
MTCQSLLSFWGTDLPGFPTSQRDNMSEIRLIKLENETKMEIDIQKKTITYHCQNKHIRDKIICDNHKIICGELTPDFPITTDGVVKFIEFFFVKNNDFEISYVLQKN